jgi:hypothetical protein
VFRSKQKADSLAVLSCHASGANVPRKRAQANTKGRETTVPARVRSREEPLSHEEQTPPAWGGLQSWTFKSLQTTELLLTISSLASGGGRKVKTHATQSLLLRGGTQEHTARSADKHHLHQAPYRNVCSQLPGRTDDSLNAGAGPGAH